MGFAGGMDETRPDTSRAAGSIEPARSAPSTLLAEPAGPPPDFFVSRAGDDKRLAQAIASIIEDARRPDGTPYRVVIQDWDFANHNFMERMDWALSTPARLIGLLSPEYLASPHCRAEWLNRLGPDPLNMRGGFIAMRSLPCAPVGLLTAIAYWDLVGVTDAQVLKAIVLAAIDPTRGKDHAALAPFWREPKRIVASRLRARVPGFTGRTELLYDIDGALSAVGTAALTPAASLSGMGGIGKTTLAHQYGAIAAEEGLFHGVWWLNAARDKGSTAEAPAFSGLQADIVALGAEFNPALRDIGGDERAARMVLDQLMDGQLGAPWLLIYDNVDSDRTLQQWGPRGRHVRALVTTRIASLNGAEAIAVEKMTPDESLAFLKSALASRTDIAEADLVGLAAVVDHLPLALGHAAAYLRKARNASAASYIAALTARMRHAPAGAEYDKAVFATFLEAAEEAERQAPGAQSVLELLAFLAPADISESLLRQPARLYPEAMAEVAADPARLENAVGRLIDLSLLGFESARRTLSIHRLVQAAVRDRLSSRAPDFAASAVRTVGSVWSQTRRQDTAARTVLVQHGLAATAAAPDATGPYLTYLLRELGDHLAPRGSLEEVRVLYARAQRVGAAFAARDPDNTEWQRDLSVSHERIGDVLLRAGDRDGAVEAYRQALAIRQRLAARDPDNTEWQRDLSVSWTRLGKLALDAGDRTEARRAYSADLAIAGRLAGLDAGNADWQVDLAISHVQMLPIAETEADGLAHLTTAAHILRRLADAGRLPTERTAMLAGLEAALAESGPTR